jgi:hypothetical protein
MADDANRGGTRVIVIVAIIGLLSTVGASALGGYWGSKSAEVSAESLERQFELQRTAAVFDLRREVYIDFVRANSQACQAWGGQDDAAVEPAVLEVLHQLALVEFIASSELLAPAEEFANAVMTGEACRDLDSLAVYYNDFVITARMESQ